MRTMTTNDFIGCNVTGFCQHRQLDSNENYDNNLILCKIRGNLRSSVVKQIQKPQITQINTD